MNNIEHTHIKC